MIFDISLCFVEDMTGSTPRPRTPESKINDYICRFDSLFHCEFLYSVFQCLHGVKTNAPSL